MAISFMEAPVKFTAPSLTLAVGLDVGMQVFGTLNKIEIMFAVIGAVLLLLNKSPLKAATIFIFILIILLLQTFWLLPDLSERAIMIINGETPPASNLHIAYIILEAVKLIALFLLGLMLVLQLKNEFNISVNETKYQEK